MWHRTSSWIQIDFKNTGHKSIHLRSPSYSFALPDGALAGCSCEVAANVASPVLVLERADSHQVSAARGYLQTCRGGRKETHPGSLTRVEQVSSESPGSVSEKTG